MIVKGRLMGIELTYSSELSSFLLNAANGLTPPFSVSSTSFSISTFNTFRRLIRKFDRAIAPRINKFVLLKNGNSPFIDISNSNPSSPLYDGAGCVV